MDFTENSTSEALVTLSTQVSDLEFSVVMNTSETPVKKIAPKFHTHPYFELITASRGSFAVEKTSGESVTVRTGDFCIVAPKQLHCTSSADASAEMLSMRFSYKRVKGAPAKLFDIFDSSASKMGDMICFTEGVRISEFMLSVRNEIVSGDIAAEYMAQSLLQCLCIELLRVFSMSALKEDAQMIGRDDNKESRYFMIEKWFDENSSRRVTERDLAASLNLSSRQVSRILREIFDMSFRELLIKVRLDNALRMLTKSDWPIDKIAVSVGYNNLSGFYKAFRARFGMTVGEYRKNHMIEAAKK